MYFTTITLSAISQDLEPRFLSAIPTGGNFAIASYGYSSGNILLDNTLPIEDLNARLNSVIVGYARSFKLLNKLAKFDVVLPYSFGQYSGVVTDIDSSVYRNGFGDPLLRFSLILIGHKPVGVSEFMQQGDNKFKLGATFRMRLPLGQYDPEKFLNLGANRWGFKLGVAGSYTVKKKLIFEGHLNTWLFTENKAFFNGNTLYQKPLLSAQLHVTYLMNPRLWFAVSFGRSGLGETVINGIEKNNTQNDSRFGVAFAYKVNKHNSLKLAFTSGITTRYGADFTTILLAYQFMWFDKK